MKRFNLFFPIFFVVGETIIISVVSSLMHYITFTSWNLYNTLIVIFWILTIIYTKSYNIGRGVTYLNTLQTALKSIFILFSVVSIVNLFLEPYGPFTIKSIFFALAILTFSVLLYRISIHFILDSYRSYGGNIKQVAIIGYDKMGKELFKSITENTHLGLRSNGIYSLKKTKKDYQIPYLGVLNNFYQDYNSFDEIFMSSKLPYKTQKELIDFCDQNLISVKLLPELANYEFKNFFIKKLYNIPVIEVNQLPLDFWYNKAFKRIFDIIFSLFVLVFFVSWMYLIFGIIIKTSSKGPVLFFQKRHGLGGKIFYCYKFRTMVINNQEDTKFADNNDLRLTKFGKFLRISALDEMPQFVNVLFGEMSVVGPRPHPVNLNEQFSRKIQKFSKRHQFKPGITGLAQIRGFRGKIYGFYDMSSRVKLDRYYFKKWSILFDLRICLKTFFGIIKFNFQSK